ncbi:MAG TPA: type III secretion protein [Myxococcaceae bacterium]|jgi:type III secretion protein J|nr:type III secretion protein [Myxococcaceae bacterium]
MNASFRRWLTVLAAALTLTGCSLELQHNLNESDANEILVLLQENGIDSSKIKEEGGNEPTFTVKVAKADYRQAAKLLNQYSLPHPKSPGLEIFLQSKGMIPTQTEERAMLMQALGGEVSKALQKVDGVLEARTIVNVPENNDLTQPDKKPQPTAAVLVKYRANVEGKQPLNDIDLRNFVSRSLPDMRPENVAVIQVAAQLPTAEVSAESRMQEVLGFQMSKASADTFRVVVGVTALVILIMAAFTAWNFMRSGAQAPKARPRPKPEG